MLKVNRLNYLEFNPKQRWLIDNIEGWGAGNEENRDIIFPKEFIRLTVKAIGESPHMKRVFQLTENEPLKHIGDYDFRDPNWKLQALQDAGVLDGFIDDEVTSYFLTKRLLNIK